MKRSTLSRVGMLCLGMFLVIACATTSGAKGGGDKPAWIDGQDSRFPKEKVLVGVGTGDSRTASEEDARAALAKVFRVEIQSLTQSLNRYVGYTKSGGEESWLTMNDISQLTKTYTNQVLEGVQIAERWTDPKGTVYTLATLDRNAARNRLEQQVMDLDSNITQLVAEADQQTDKISKLKMMLRALEKMREREVLNSQLRVVHVLGRGVESEGINPGAFDAKLTAILASIKVYVQIGGQGEGKVKQAIVESVTRGRLQVQDTEEGADIIVRGQVRGMPVNRTSNTGFKFAQFEAKIEMVNAATGATFGSIMESRKEGAKDLLDAKNMCLMRLGKNIVAKFNTELHNFLLK